jgi:hypothetical protein
VRVFGIPGNGVLHVFVVLCPLLLLYFNAVQPLRVIAAARKRMTAGAGE